MYHISRFICAMGFVFLALSNTANAAIAVCIMLPAEFIEGEQPYTLHIKEEKVDINIKVNVYHRDKVTTTAPLKKSINVGIRGANWQQIPLIVEDAIVAEMMSIARAQCEKKGCNK